MIEKEVTFVATFKARIRVAENEEEGLVYHNQEEDAIFDISIPENHQCFYVEDTFDVKDVKELKRVDTR